MFLGLLRIFNCINNFYIAKDLIIGQPRSAVLTESQDTSKALPVTDQEMQEESSPEHLETLEDDRSENEIIQQE
jgi:hypothetical protein